MENINTQPKIKKQRMLIIDANALLHRAYHALPSLTTPQGEPIGGVYGFGSILLRALTWLRPDFLIACFDLPKPTFRHERFPQYKAQRPKTPLDLASQIKLAKQFLKNLGILVLEKEGFEADDVIGTIVDKKNTKDQNIEKIILTGDLDTLQLISEEVKIYAPKRGISDVMIYDEEALKKRFDGLGPEAMIEYKGLKGDPSDNIPGVPGVGEKTAQKLIKKFGKLEEIYKILENKKELKKLEQEKVLGKNLIAKLKENKDLAFFSRELSTIRKDAPINFSLKDAIWQADLEKAKNAFLGLGLKSLFKRFEEMVRRDQEQEKNPEQESKAPIVKQQALF